MKQAVAFYVSGHGYGHAVRMARVIRRFREIVPGRRIVVRTVAPKWLFPPDIAVHPADFDSGAVENGPLRIDARATVARLRKLIRNRAGIVAREASFLRNERAALLVADVPFLAGEAAATAAVPSIAIGNFTWDWIYEPLLAGHNDSPELLRAMRESYGKMGHFLRLPFGQAEGFEIFPRVTEVPLVASVSTRGAGEILRDLGLAPGDRRRRLLIAMRGGLPQGILARAAAGSPDYLFLEPGQVEFADLVKISHIVVSKLGYGIAAACAAHATPLLYPPRTGFREDAVLEQQLRRCIPMRRITEERFFDGDWKRDIDALAQLEPSMRQVPSNGDLVCAEIIRKTLDAG
ncbi:MAG: hypothetical protein LC126_07450 [Bryobacterales bacterium]|nr:hypothetical protein [Bryobacterales bacterium]